MQNGNEKLAKNWKDMAVRIFSEHPDWNAAQIRRQLIVILGSEIKAPGKSAVQKAMALWKEKHKDIQESGFDNPWHLGLMRHPEYGIKAEAIPYIFQVKDWCRDNVPDTPVSIRIAFWISQFYHMYPAKMKDKEKHNLWQVAWVYAQYEIISELSGNPDIDTTELDDSFWYGGPALPIIRASAGE